MKKLNVLLVAIFFISLIANGQWTVKDPWLVEHYEINYVHAANEFDVWICAKDQSENHNGPMFSHTEDGGETWESGYIVLHDYLAPSMIFGFDGFPYAFAPVYSTDASSVEYQGIHATFDGGQTWQRQSGVFEDPTAWPDIVYFWSTTWGIAIGDPVDGYFEIYNTTDLGTTWQKLLQTNIPDPLPGEAAIVGNFDVVGPTIWFSTTKGRVYRSEDYGINWSVFSSPFSSFTKVVFKDSDYGWLQDVGQWEFSQIVITTNGGQDWELLSHTGPLLNWDIAYIPGTMSTLISSGAYLNNGISASYNDGNTWYWLEEPGNKYFKMDWFDWQHGWVGGYDELQQRPMVNVYSGPGIGELVVTPFSLDFGDVAIGSTSTQLITVTNVSNETLELFNVWGNNGFFLINPTNGFIDPNGGTFEIEVSFSPESVGLYEEMITIETSSPFIPSTNVAVQGNGIIPESGLAFDPESFNESLFTGQTVMKTLSVTNNTDLAVNYEASVDCDLSLGVLGWNFGSTPLGCDDGILCGGADQAMFVKEFTLSEFSSAQLFLGYDDGIRCWVNGMLVFDDLHGGDGLSYWDQEIDITSYLTPGKNRVSAVVFNGIYGGCCEGEFDCQLTVDGVDIILRGDENYGTPEAMWYYFGQSGQQLVPDADVNGKNWWEADFGKYQWVNLVPTVYVGFEDLGWTYRSAPFYGEDILSSSPDNAQFVKDIEVGNFSWATLYLGFDDGCKVWINGVEAFDYQYEVHGLNYWDHEDDVTAFLQPGHNRISIEVYNGIYGGGGWGGFDCQLIVDDIEVIKRGSDYNGAAEAMWWVYGEGNQILTPPLDGSSNHWYDMNYCSGNYYASNYLTDLNWNFGSAPFPGEHGVLGSAPDNAQFIRDFEIGEYSSALLFLGFDDGCRVWINGDLLFDFHDDIHSLEYWNQNLDITGLLIPGRNRIAVEVYNGIYAGGGEGGFDCLLLVDDVPVIQQGLEHAGDFDAMWYYFGQTGQILTPPADMAGLQWFEKNYGINTNINQPTNSLSGTIAAGETATISVFMNASGLSTGEYSTNIHFTTEASEEEIDIPVNLYVTSEGVLTITPNELDFGDFYAGYPETIPLTLKNTGFQTLTIINIWCDFPDISLEFYGVILDPGQTVVLNVTLDSYTGGPLLSTLNFQTTSYTSITTEIPISGFGMDAPHLVIENLDYMYAYLATDNSETQNLHINNWGGSTLTFTFPQMENKGGKNTSAAVGSSIPNQPVKFRKNEVVNRVAAPVYQEDDVVRHENLELKPAEQKNRSSVDNDFNLFWDDMENGATGWTTENVGEGSSQWHQVTFNSFSPNTSWWCGNELTGTYVNGFAVREMIITPEILLPPVESAIYLEFTESYEIEDGYDQGFVDISLDGGYEWIRIRDFIPGSSDGWVTTTFDISQFFGNSVKIRFFFDTGDDIANDFPGWFVDDLRVYVDGLTFLDMTPALGAVNSGEGFDISVTFDASGYGTGYYPGFILFITNDPDNHWFYLPAIMEVWEGGNGQTLNLPAGWSGISGYLSPLNPQLDQMFSPVQNDLVILQNLENVYWPEEGINTIGDWNYLNGYAVKMTNSNSLFVEGTLPENRTIEMQSGWSLIPVISMNPVNVADFDMLESLNMIKDVAGTGIYWPAYNINTLGQLQPGKSYLLHTSGYETFEYPPMVKSSAINGFEKADPLVSPWNEISTTPITHTIAVPADCLTHFSMGDVVGIFTQDGYCAGFANVKSLSENIAIVVFGDDPTTAAKDGMEEGEPMVFRLMRTENSETADLEVTFSSAQPNQGSFADNGISAVSSIKLGALSSNEPGFESITIQPNPASDWLKISSGVPVLKIEISDARGLAYLNLKGEDLSGSGINVSEWPKGVYFVKIFTQQGNFIQKVIRQ